MAMVASARPSTRLLFMFASFLAVLAVISGRLIYVQGINSDRFVAMAADQRQRKIEIQPQRGSVYDRNGAELAISLDMKTIFANPRFISDPKAAAAAMAPILGLDPGAIETKLTTKRGFVYIARQVDPASAAKVKALGIPGVDMVADSKRFYPSDQLAAHVVGFVGSESQGLAGLEGRFQKLLAGTPGEMLIERDPQGRAIPSGHSFYKAPQAGDDLILTLDREVQFAAESALQNAMSAYSAKGGSIIVMRPSTGEILALANAPTFNPNDVRSSVPDQRKNRALVDVYEPGSANKVITASAALEAGVVSPDDVISVPDHFKLGSKTFHDAHPHATEDLTFSQVIQQSSNVGTIKVAQRLGKEKLYDYLVRFGYGKPTGLDFPGEAPGILPKPQSWWETSMGTIPIGQGVAVTGMQIVSVFATLANDGVAVQPKLIAATVDAQGRRVATTPSAKRRVIKSETALTMAKILTGVTQEKHGTGHLAAIPGYEVAGKTGTAQKPLPGGAGYGGYVASFIGYAPAGDPQVVVGVILDEPTPIWGGYTAAPTFKEVMQFTLRHLGIGPGPVLLPQDGATPLPAPARSGGASPNPDATPATTGTAD